MSTYFDLITNGTDIKIVSTSECIYCGEEFPLFDLEKTLLDKYDFKYPEHCFRCNFRLLYSFVNDKHLYYRLDSQTGEKIISSFSEGFEGKIFDVKNYKKFILDDGGLKYGQDIGQDIFEDFISLYNQFPHASRGIYPGTENSDYSSHIGWAKNVYMSYCVFTDCENIYYSFIVLGGCQNIFSSFRVTGSSNVVSSLDVKDSYNIFYSDNVLASSDILFGENLENCQECIFCCNRVNRKYQIFNKQYEKEEYLKIKKDIYKRINNKKELEFLIDKYELFLEKNLLKEAMNINNSEGVVGDNIYYSNNCANVFSTMGLKNSVNTFQVGDHKKDHMTNIINSVDAGSNCENIIGSGSFGSGLYNIFFSFSIVGNSKNIYYSYDIYACEEIMFCVGLKSKKFCILNKQYTKEEYFKLKDHIIQGLKQENKWGDPFPLFSELFPYNDTLAYDFFQVNKIIDKNGKEQIINKNEKGVIKIFENKFLSKGELDLGGKKKIPITYRTKNKEINIPDHLEVIQAENLPNIEDISDDLIDKAVICKNTGRPFRIIKEELDFYKKRELPLPITHNEFRIEELISRRSMGKLYVGICDKCKEEILTVYKREEKYKIYCPKCYKKEIYS